MKYKIYAIDFDGTLCENAYPNIGKPITETITFIKDLKLDGGKLILWTCRAGEHLEKAIKWCENQGIYFDSVNENLPEVIKNYNSDSRKITADYYIDDKGINAKDIFQIKEGGGYMKIEIRNNQVIIEGYVNAVERDSKILSKSMSPYAMRSFVERVKSKTFQRALENNDNVEVRFNHRKTVGSTKDNLMLHEDNIGLYAVATITDPDVIKSARKNELRGWSFGFTTNKDLWEDVDDSLQRRTLEDINLNEVSILTANPAYVATSIEMRGEDCVVNETRGLEVEIEIVDNTKKEKIDYSLYEKRIKYLKLKR